jgi:uncharacterized SAM-binding protein YcdF (DUF218 family)
MQTEKNQKKSCFSSCSRIAGSGLALIILLVLLMGGGYILLRGAGAFLIVADGLEPAKAIVILGGGNESRMAEALALYEEGYSRLIILTETGIHLDEFDYLQSFDLQIQLLNNGIPSGNILITNEEVNSTLDEAKAIRELLQNQQLDSAIIVTDPYHARRTRIIFNDVLEDSIIRVRIRPTRSSWYNSQTWFLSAKGWQYTILEYAKLAAYWVGLDR